MSPNVSIGLHQFSGR